MIADPETIISKLTDDRKSSQQTSSHDVDESRNAARQDREADWRSSSADLYNNIGDD